MRRPGPAVALLLAALLGAGAADSEPTGLWARSESERAADDAALEAEIERVTEPLSIWLQGIARAILRRNVTPTEHYRISREDGVLVIRSAVGPVWRVDGRLERSEAGGTTSRWEPPDTLHQSWFHGETRGTTVWHFDAARDRLEIAITVHEARLPGPVRYSTRYRRVREP